MDFVQQRHQLQIKQEVEQEQKVCLESLKNQTKEQQEMKKNSTKELIELERNKKRSIEQLDQQIRIKTKKIAELGRYEVVKKQELKELLQKVQSQKRMLVMLESQAQKATETWKSNFDIIEKDWNCRVAEINAEEERRLKKVEDKERTLRIEIGQKETVERETTRKEFELELEKVKKSIAEGYAKLKKIYNLTKMVRNNRYLQQMPANQQSTPIHSNQLSPLFNPILPDSPVDVEHCVPPQIKRKQPIQSGLFPRLPSSALPAQPSQLVCQFYNQQKVAAVNEFDSSFNTTSPASSTCVIPEMVQSSSSPSESTTSCPVPVNPINIDINQRPNSNNGSSDICYAPSTSTVAPTVTSTTSTLFIPEVFTSAKSSTTTSNLISSASTLPKSFSLFSPVTSNLDNSTLTSNLISSPTFNLDNFLPIYFKLIPSATTSTSSSFSANLDKSSTLAKSLSFDNGIEVITIDDSDNDDEEELTGLDDCGTIEDNETSKSINQIQNFSTIDELIDVNPIGGNDIAPVGSTAAVVKPMDDFENEPTESTDEIIERLGPATSIQNLDLGNDSELVDDQFELVGGQNDNQQQKITSKSNNNNRQQKIKTKRLPKLRGSRGYSKLRNNNEKKKESNEERQQRLELGRSHYYLRKRQPTLQQNEEEPEQQQQNSQTSSELNEMGQNGKLRYDTDIDNRATLKSKENGRGRKRKRNCGGVETSKQSKREHCLAQKREWMKQKRANETPEQRKHRLAQRRECEKQRIANQTPEQKECRLAQKREYDKQKLANETPEQRKHRLAQKRERRANETSEQREHRLALQREYDKQKLANETPEQRECRLAKQRVIQNNYLNRKNNSPEQKPERSQSQQELN